jgi:hypothetical protein
MERLSLTTQQSHPAPTEEPTVRGDDEPAIDSTWFVAQQDKDGALGWRLTVDLRYLGWKFQTWGTLPAMQYRTEDEAKDKFEELMRAAIVRHGSEYMQETSRWKHTEHNIGFTAIREL